MQITKFKKCPKCKKYKLRNKKYYYEDVSRTDKLTSWCKVCRINRKGHRKAKLIREYGITEDTFNVMLQEQNYVCKICKKRERVKINGKIKTLCVDHCHLTGKIRGLLCNKCNTGLGKFNDDSNLVKKALEYLNENQ